MSEVNNKFVLKKAIQLRAVVKLHLALHRACNIGRVLIRVVAIWIVVARLRTALRRETIVADLIPAARIVLGIEETVLILGVVLRLGELVVGATRGMEIEVGEHGDRELENIKYEEDIVEGANERKWGEEERNGEYGHD